jgi:flagellar hook-length control protein FliK
LTPQLQACDLEKTTEAETSDVRKSTETQGLDQLGEKAVAATPAKLGENASEGAKGDLAYATKNAVTPNIETDVSPAAVENSPSQALATERLDSEGNDKTTFPELMSHLKPIQKSGASTKTSDADTDPSKSGQGKPKAVSKPERTPRSIETDNDRSNENNDEIKTTRPRNKRAEHLAERASESAPVSSSLNSSNSTNAIEPPTATAKDKSDAPTDLGSVSGTSSSNSSTPVSSSSPLIATPIALNNDVLRGNVTSSLSLRPNAETISAVGTATTRGGIPTDPSNSSYTGAVSNPGRSEQGRGEVARSNAGTQISAYQEVKLVQRVLRGVEQLANGGGQVRLRLHPPELGSLQMSLRMEAGQVFAKLEVENSTARDALLNNVQTLKDRMAEQGMNVAAFEVEVSTDSSGSGTSGSNMQRDGGSDSQSRWDNATSRFAQQNSNRLSTEPGPAERISGTAWTRNNGSLDLTV